MGMLVTNNDFLADDSLFFALAEDLKTPLVRIAYKAELADQTNPAITDIHRMSREALTLLDAYLLGAKAQNGQAKMILEPVNPSAVLVDTLHDLSGYAKRYGCELRLSTPARSGSAMLNRAALQAALAAIGRVFIEAQDVVGTTHKFIEMANYSTAKGFAVGVFHSSDQKMLDTQLLSRARSNVGAAARPFVGLASGASAQLFIAEQIIGAMHSTLRSAHRNKLSGLALDLLSSTQLSLVA